MNFELRLKKLVDDTEITLVITELVYIPEQKGSLKREFYPDYVEIIDGYVEGEEDGYDFWEEAKGTEEEVLKLYKEYLESLKDYDID